MKHPPIISPSNTRKQKRSKNKQARAELEKFTAEREAMREKKQSNNRKEEQVSACLSAPVDPDLPDPVALPDYTAITHQNGVEKNKTKLNDHPP
jgi:hypothetical protein